MPVAIQLLPVGDLEFDPENPRLPEQLQGASQSDILEFFYYDGSLEELARSFADNGYFVHEPMIILAEPDGPKHVVLEGNRRLATLKILHGHEEAVQFSFAEVEPTDEQLARLQEIPCYLAPDRERAHDFLGFRHIGGIKKWEPEAKARYLVREIEKAVDRGSAEPFRDVARRVGSNAQGVRNPYIAMKVLKIAAIDFGIRIQYVQQERFGVWQRCMNSTDIRLYIGLDTPKTYAEIQQQLPRLRDDELGEVIRDLTPEPGRRKAVVSDSRQVTDYGRVLRTERARAVLRKYGDLQTAIQIADRTELPERLGELVERCKVLYEELPLASIDERLLGVAEELRAVAKSIRDLIVARVREANA